MAEKAEESAPVILVIDDDEFICNLLARPLRGANYRVITANDGASGLEYFRRERPDLVLIDFAMPEKNGFEIVAEMRRIESPQKRAVIVMLTAFSETYLASMDVDVAVDSYLTKPVSQGDLAGFVRDLLAARSS